MIELATTDHLLSTTRAVRRHLDLARPVPREILLDCLRLAQQAPTASNRQLWRWIVVTDPGKRIRLAELYREVGAESLRADRDASMGQDRRVYESAVYLADHLHEVPVHVIPCIDKRLSATPDTAESAAFYGAILPAAWSFCLALRARGLGTTWTTLHLEREREAAELLGIPTDVTQVALLPVAYTTRSDFKPATRPPVEDTVCWDTWDL
jgi:nitroreductase